MSLYLENKPRGRGEPSSLFSLQWKCMKRVSRRRNTLPNFTQLSARPSPILAFTSHFIWSSICLHYAFFLRIYLTMMALHYVHAQTHALPRNVGTFLLWGLNLRLMKSDFTFTPLYLLIFGAGWVAEGLKFADALENLPLFFTVEHSLGRYALICHKFSPTIFITVSCKKYT